MNSNQSNIASPPRKHEVSGYSIEKTAKLMKLSFSRLLLMHPEVDITVDQWVILQLVQRHQALSQQQLCELSYKDAPTVTRIIDLLVHKGMTTRTAHPDDRRRYVIELTPDGQQTYDAIKPILQEFRSEAYEGISDKEMYNLETTMNKIFFNLSKQN
jgi:DNA-binding MarR family transcriptional regulator